VLKDMTMEKREIAPLDALYPTMRVSSTDERKQTIHRLSAMHKSTYQEEVKNKTYRENRSCAKNVEGEIAPLDALYPTIRGSSDDEKQQTHHRMSAMHESTYKEDVKKIAPLDASYPTIRVSSDSKKLQTHNRMSATYENTYQEDVKKETYRENGSRAKKIKMIAFAMEGEEGPGVNQRPKVHLCYGPTSMVIIFLPGPPYHIIDFSFIFQHEFSEYIHSFVKNHDFGL
jgi:hypothetical protein